MNHNNSSNASYEFVKRTELNELRHEFNSDFKILGSSINELTLQIGKYTFEQNISNKKMQELTEMVTNINSKALYEQGYVQGKSDLVKNVFNFKGWGAIWKIILFAIVISCSSEGLGVFFHSINLDVKRIERDDKNNNG